MIFKYKNILNARFFPDLDRDVRILHIAYFNLLFFKLPIGSDLSPFVLYKFYFLTFVNAAENSDQG